MTQFCANLVNLACIVEFHKTLSGKFATFFLRLRWLRESSFHERKLFVIVGLLKKPNQPIEFAINYPCFVYIY